MTDEEISKKIRLVAREEVAKLGPARTHEAEVRAERAEYDAEVRVLLDQLNDAPGAVSSDPTARIQRLRWSIDRVTHLRAKLGLP